MRGRTCTLILPRLLWPRGTVESGRTLRNRISYVASLCEIPRNYKSEVARGKLEISSRRFGNRAWTFTRAVPRSCIAEQWNRGSIIDCESLRVYWLLVCISRFEPVLSLSSIHVVPHVNSHLLSGGIPDRLPLPVNQLWRQQIVLPVCSLKLQERARQHVYRCRYSLLSWVSACLKLHWNLLWAGSCTILTLNFLAPIIIRFHPLNFTVCSGVLIATLALCILRFPLFE